MLRVSRDTKTKNNKIERNGEKGVRYSSLSLLLLPLLLQPKKQAQTQASMDQWKKTKICSLMGTFLYITSTGTDTHRQFEISNPFEVHSSPSLVLAILRLSTVSDGWQILCSGYIRSDECDNTWSFDEQGNTRWNHPQHLRRCYSISLKDQIPQRMGFSMSTTVSLRRPPLHARTLESCWMQYLFAIQTDPAITREMMAL